MSAYRNTFEGHLNDFRESIAARDRPVAHVKIPGAWSIKVGAFCDLGSFWGEALRTAISQAIVQDLQEHEDAPSYILFYEKGLVLTLNLNQDIDDDNPRFDLPYADLFNTFVDGLHTPMVVEEDGLTIGEGATRQGVATLVRSTTAFLEQVTKMHELALSIQAQFEAGGGDQEYEEE